MKKSTKTSSKNFDSAFMHTGYSPCWKTHPAFQIGEYTVYGGSCSTPLIKDADIYIGFDHSMDVPPPLYPWQPKPATDCKKLHIYFFIQDMSVPKDAAEFKNMVIWAAGQVREGKKLHAGCIGGHGRTGLFLAALVQELIGEDDAITYVRKHYCDHAVETTSQVNWLVQHFGIKPIQGAKAKNLGFEFGTQPPTTNTLNNASMLIPFQSAPFCIF